MNVVVYSHYTTQPHTQPTPAVVYDYMFSFNPSISSAWNYHKLLEQDLYFIRSVDRRFQRILPNLVKVATDIE